MSNIQRALEIDGWMSEGELQWLADAAETHHAIVEVGCLKGRSTRALVDNTPGRVYAIDPWPEIYYSHVNQPLIRVGDVIYNEFINNMQDIPNLYIFRGTLPHFAKEFGSYVDFIFLDGDHRYPYIKLDLDASLKIIQKGGIIAGHDYCEENWPDVKKIVHEYFGNNISVNGSIWWTQR